MASDACVRSHYQEATQHDCDCCSCATENLTTPDVFSERLHRRDAQLHSEVSYQIRDSNNKRQKRCHFQIYMKKCRFLSRGLVCISLFK